MGGFENLFEVENSEGAGDPRSIPILGELPELTDLNEADPSTEGDLAKWVPLGLIVFSFLMGLDCKGRGGDTGGGIDPDEVLALCFC